MSLDHRGIEAKEDRSTRIRIIQGLLKRAQGILHKKVANLRLPAPIFDGRFELAHDGYSCSFYGFQDSISRETIRHNDICHSV